VRRPCSGGGMVRSRRWPRAQVQSVLDSIADANNYLRSNVEPVEAMLDNLLSNFDPSGPGKDGHSLSLSGGGLIRRVSGLADVRSKSRVSSTPPLTPRVARSADSALVVRAASAAALGAAAAAARSCRTITRRSSRSCDSRSCCGRKSWGTCAARTAIP